MKHSGMDQNNIWPVVVSCCVSVECGDDVSWSDMRDLLQQLPDVHYSLLRYLCHFLTLVECNHKENRMTALNLATVFGPSVFQWVEPLVWGRCDKHFVVALTMISLIEVYNTFQPALLDFCMALYDTLIWCPADMEQIPSWPGELKSNIHSPTALFWSPPALGGNVCRFSCLTLRSAPKLVANFAHLLFRECSKQSVYQSFLCWKTKEILYEALRNGVDETDPIVGQATKTMSWKRLQRPPERNCEDRW